MLISKERRRSLKSLRIVVLWKCRYVTLHPLILRLLLLFLFLFCVAYCGTLTLFEIVCRTSGSQKYFIRLVRTVSNANLSPHRAMCPALDAAPTNVNEA